ncbi:periplasmic solute-binding protein [Desulfosporosinus meridiei]|uniref:Putative periplasmic solute-binding protein n=1 Tax=Desulfosporosinus meridiei (strain ATCC BAA-275 / DSM 13257 / KCTC 12902 / NCIMB 13706 / S10) TaxID=768704 RepID=J7ITD0_DESMD|nr:periplasmic solute-binding protein [Desulfosporosinus meridiei]AFQ42343.1 putative periplasmic solute-binding protein [Desulfosporosinus meridiei DSM 13257]
MKVTRSFWLGLGSGLILSAIIVMFVSPHLRLNEPSNVQTGIQSVTQSDIQSDNQSDQNSMVSSSNTEQPSDIDPAQPIKTSESTPNDSSTGLQSSAQIERDFVIPKGANAERIAELLFSEGFILDKTDFLKQARLKRVERKFQAGTFKLSVGLTVEETINRLLK